MNSLVKLAARAFYDDITTKGENQPKTGRSDNRGIAVVVLDALTRRQWVREEDLAKDLKLHTKQLRRTLRFFEEEKLVTRDHRKETAKGAKIYNAAVAATADGQQTGREGDEKLKMHTHSYCCLDYAQIYDVVRYRLHRMKKKLKDELESKNTVQEYICPNCSKRYTALDALRLISPYDEYFHCESCNGVLVAESDKILLLKSYEKRKVYQIEYTLDQNSGERPPTIALPSLFKVPANVVVHLMVEPLVGGMSIQEKLNYRKKLGAVTLFNWKFKERGHAFKYSLWVQNGKALCERSSAPLLSEEQQ
ncbi:UNVERIFIED_CONTAM: Transcription initiation factor IIE subunit alpha [Sesamum calycinum]|uniref:Transcription initiation factor IIE subunit alpha n=1 Tax=Sesamum calycinum TaxID=2727403 RepID=A0AAW2MCC0_9LAMI